MSLIGYADTQHFEVSLTPELEQFVQSRRPRLVSDRQRGGPRRRAFAHGSKRETALEELRAKIRRGVDQADRSELLRTQPPASQMA